MGNNCNQKCGCGAGSCPFDRLLNMDRMCGCASGVIADVISNCDSFCNANANVNCGSCGRNHCGCGCRNRNRCCD